MLSLGIYENVVPCEASVMVHFSVLDASSTFPRRSHEPHTGIFLGKTMKPSNLHTLHFDRAVNLITNSKLVNW